MPSVRIDYCWKGNFTRYSCLQKKKGAMSHTCNEIRIWGGAVSSPGREVPIAVFFLWLYSGYFRQVAL